MHLDLYSVGKFKSKAQKRRTCSLSIDWVSLKNRRYTHIKFFSWGMDLSPQKNRHISSFFFGFSDLILERLRIISWFVDMFYVCCEFRTWSTNLTLSSFNEQGALGRSVVYSSCHKTHHYSTHFSTENLEYPSFFVVLTKFRWWQLKYVFKRSPRTLGKMNTFWMSMLGSTQPPTTRRNSLFGATGCTSWSAGWVMSPWRSLARSNGGYSYCHMG